MTAESRKLAALSVVCRHASTAYFSATGIEAGASTMNLGQLVQLLDAMNKANFKSLVLASKDLQRVGASHLGSYGALQKSLSEKPQLGGQVTLTKARQLFEMFEGRTRGGTGLITAARAGDVTDMRTRIDAGVDLDARDQLGNTALHWAVTSSKTRAVALLIQSRAQIDLRNASGATALLCAAWHGRVAIMQQLLDARADVTVKDNNGKTALITVTESGRPDMAQALRDAGAKE